MVLSQINVNNLFESRFNLIREEAQRLESVKSQLMIKHQGFTALFNRVNKALESLRSDYTFPRPRNFRTL